MSVERMSRLDAGQVLRSSYNESDSSIVTGGFVGARIGNKITVALSTTSITNDTETYSYYENSSDLLYTIKIIYTDGTRDQMISAERIA